MHYVVLPHSCGLRLKFLASMDIATLGYKINCFVTGKIMVWCECCGVSLKVLFSVILSLLMDICNTCFLIWKHKLFYCSKTCFDDLTLKQCWVLNWKLHHLIFLYFREQNNINLIWKVHITWYVAGNKSVSLKERCWQGARKAGQQP